MKKNKMKKSEKKKTLDQGKGSRSRVSNLEAYRKGWDKIFRKRGKK